MRDRCRQLAAVGAAMVTLPAAAMVAPGASSAQAPEAGQFSLENPEVGYGKEIVASGTTPASPATAPESLELQFAPAGSSSWRMLAQSATTPGAPFRLSARLTESGQVRVLAAGFVLAAPAAARVVVRALLRLRRRSADLLGGGAVWIRGQLLPGLRARPIVLQGRMGRVWRTIARARTGADGAFTIRYVPAALGPERLRVRFPGDRLNAPAETGAGRVTVFTEGVASWYYDQGGTACGFRAYYGVANRTLPCGTTVQFRLGSRQVSAVVDDRGPFVAGREWDLDQNAAGALGLVGVQTVWSTG